MKKLFLLIAFSGIVAASSALTISSLTKTVTVTIGGEEKKDKKKCDKDKACCKKGGESAKACSGEKKEAKSCSGAAGEAKACCKGKTAAKAEAPATPEAK